MIHKIFSAATIILFFAVTACEKLEDLTTFNISHETEFTIPGQNSGVGSLLSIPRAEIKTSSEQTFKNNKTSAKLVKEVVLNELVLAITAPESGNFDFLNEISIYIKADGEEEVLLATKTNIPENGSKTIIAETTNTNLRPFLVKENYSIRTVAKTDQILDNDLEVKISMTFKVKAGIVN